MSASHFRELEVWQLSMQLAKRIYELTAGFPREELYGFVSQIRRSAVSIPSNIAEGNGRATTRDYARFVSLAMGSCAELQTQLLLSGELSFGDDTKRADALEMCERAGRMLLRLHQALVRKLDHETKAPDLHPAQLKRVPSPESRKHNHA